MFELLASTVIVSPNLHELTKKVQQELELYPSGIDESAKAAKTLWRLLSNLGEISRGMSELRNAYGTGHGKDGRWKGLTPRHARLAVGSAITLTNFLFETHRMRQASG